MTKPQNTSEQLTEQWKKGELKDGKYWVKLSFGGTIITAEYLEYNGIFELDDHYYEDEEISKVLAPVPSYEEWKRFIDANDRFFEAVKSLTIERDMTQEENEQLKTEYEKECHRADELEDSYWKEVEKNKKLKELLKECRYYIGYDTYEFDEKVNKLLTKIDEVLK